MATVTEYNGAKITHVYRGPPVSTTVTVDKKLKLAYEGPVCLDHLTDSYKYDEEVQIVTFQREEPKPIFRVSKHNGWVRVEMHFPKKVWKEVVDAWNRYSP